MFPAILVFVGSGIGGVLRYASGVAAIRYLGPSFPYGTLSINILGSALLGAVTGFLTVQGRRPRRCAPVSHHRHNRRLHHLVDLHPRCGHAVGARPAFGSHRLRCGKPHHVPCGHRRDAGAGQAPRLRRVGTTGDLAHLPTGRRSSAVEQSPTKLRVPEDTRQRERARRAGRIRPTYAQPPRLRQQNGKTVVTIGRWAFPSAEAASEFICPSVGLA